MKIYKVCKRDVVECYLSYRLVSIDVRFNGFYFSRTRFYLYTCDVLLVRYRNFYHDNLYVLIQPREIFGHSLFLPYRNRRLIGSK